jgi:predicted CopG family antitoxin
MAKADKRIPVTEETWQDLNDLKDAGQTYDELLGELIGERHRNKELAKRVREVADADEEELTALDDLSFRARNSEGESSTFPDEDKNIRR